MSAFDDYIKDLMGELSAARDTLEHYDSRRKEFERGFDKQFPDYRNVRECFWKWKEQVHILTGYIERARRSQIAREPQPQQVEEPAQEEVQAKPSAPFRDERTGSPDERLIHAVRRAKGWRVGIPLASSYRHCPSAFVGQALQREIMNHDDYDRLLATGGIVSVSHGKSNNRTHAALSSAAKVFNIDADAVRREAYKVYFDITTYGKSGEHYQW